MKKLTLTLMSIALGLLVSRFFPFAPKKLMMEYAIAALLTFKVGQLISTSVDGLNLT